MVHHQTHGNAHQVPPTRSTPKPHVTQANMGCVAAVFDVSFACSGRLCVEFALSLPFFWSLKKRDFGRFAVLTKKIRRIFSTPSGAYRGLLWTKIKLALPGKPLLYFFRLSRPHSRPQNTLKKQKVSVKGNPPCR